MAVLDASDVEILIQSLENIPDDENLSKLCWSSIIWQELKPSLVKRAIDVMMQQFKNENEQIIVGIISTLGELKEPRAVEPIVSILENCQNSESPIETCISSLGAIGDLRAIDPLLEIIKNNEEPYIRENAAFSLGDPILVESMRLADDLRALEPLNEILQSEENELVLEAVNNTLDEINAWFQLGDDEVKGLVEASYSEKTSTYITLKPACKYCKQPLTETDEDYEDIEEELDHNGETKERLGYTDGELNTLEQQIEDMQLQCESCMEEIPKLCFERGLCFLCYDEPWPLMQETPGTIVIVEGKFLSCEQCKEYSEDVLSNWKD